MNAPKLELRVNKSKILPFISYYAKHRPEKAFTAYSFYPMRACRCAHDLKLKVDKDLAEYLQEVESTMLLWANTHNYLHSKFALEGLVSEDIMNLASQRLEKVLGVPTGTGIDMKGMTGEEKISSHVDLHYKCLEHTAELYNEGRIKKIDASIESEFNQVIDFMGMEIKHANKIFGKPCFVATAVYGDENAPEVHTLREIKGLLRQNKTGSVLVDLYYSGAGERIAEVIQQRAQFLITPIRRFLDIVVKKYNSQ